MICKSVSYTQIANSNPIQEQIVNDSTVPEVPVTEDKQLTTFKEQAVVAGVMDVHASKIPSIYSDPAVVAEIKSYLKRPQTMTSGAWSSTSGVILFRTAELGVPLWKTHTHYPKVLGAYGLRARTCFRVEITSTPQQAGNLRLCFYIGADDTAAANTTRCIASQLPGVSFDITSGSAFEFSVPFIHEFDFFKVQSSESLGALVLTTETPLVAVAGSVVPYVIYWWLEDVELIGASPASIDSAYLADRAAVLAKLNN